MTSDSGESGHDTDHPVIFIDKVQYRAPSDDMTGQGLRDLVVPPVPADRDLWLEVPGRSDEKIENVQVVELKNGMHFFTAPTQINPGA